MADLIREAPLGQIIRWVTGNKVLRYPEEIPGFELPATYNAVLNGSGEKSPVIARHPTAVRTKTRERKTSNSSSDDSPDTTAPGTPGASRVDLEKRDLEKHDLNRNELERHSTESLQPHEHVDAEALDLRHTKSRLETTPYTEERLEVEAELALERTQTKPVVPIKTADGIVLVDWYTTDDPANPQNWGNRKRFLVSLIICIYTFVVYSGSAIYTSSELGVIAKFHITPTDASLPLSLYVLAYGMGPLLWAPLSEIPIIGRSPIYAVTMALFTILSLPTALVKNFAGLLVLRFLQGFFGSPCLAIGAATMQDMYSLLYLPYALVAWVSAAYCGPALGPLLSGFAVTAKGWRWSLWEIL
ncbi:hypothetical protein B7494_g1721 [Chlorociboria aeruginascens]|nr:hypothetical protein B7494_g1721 [Chlorociboria aeruginascens]